jgi:hypothetical protein
MDWFASWSHAAHKEIGVRIALGASAAGIAAMIVRSVADRFGDSEPGMRRGGLPLFIEIHLACDLQFLPLRMSFRIGMSPAFFVESGSDLM